MADCLVWTNEVGGVSVLYPAAGYSLEFCQKDVPAGVTPIEYNSADLPVDPQYFNAWKIVGGVVVVDSVIQNDIAIKNLAYELQFAAQEADFQNYMTQASGIITT